MRKGVCWYTWQGCLDSQGALVASSSFMGAWDTAHTELCTCVCVGGGAANLNRAMKCASMAVTMPGVCLHPSRG